MEIEGLTITEFKGDHNHILYFGDAGDHVQELRKSGVKSTILLVNVPDWNRYLSPWKAEKVFKKGSDFGGDGDLLVKEIVKRVDNCSDDEKWYCAGYSLAGLFALYLCTKTDRFTGCVSASGSLWYPGFIDYLKEHKVQCDHVYLSLGDKEKNTKNPLMAKVEDCTKEVCELLNSYTSAVFEMNEGGHFADPSGRIAKGMRYIECYEE